VIVYSDLEELRFRIRSIRSAYALTLRGKKKYPYAESLGWLEPFIHQKGEDADAVESSSE